MQQVLILAPSAHIGTQQLATRRPLDILRSCLLAHNNGHMVAEHYGPAEAAAMCMTLLAGADEVSNKG